MTDRQIIPDPNLFTPPASVYADPDEDWQLETKSLTSSLYRGLIENGRKYQTLRQDKSFVPSDEQQFDAYEAGHVVALIMDFYQPNALFRAPIDPSLKHILDIGTGKGSWAIDVADMFPEATVHGVDLYPPPQSWVPPNCILEVDDILEDWTWKQPFDLVHMRIVDGAFTHEETERLYRQCYDNIRPGGWIEQLEIKPVLQCDDDSLPADSIAREWGPLVLAAAQRSNRPVDLYDRFTELIKKAGFVDVHEEECKWPIGAWAKDQQLKEAGTINLQHWTSGMEGYGMYLLTKFGDPRPWTQTEVQVYVAKVRRELLNPYHHIYHRAKRVWARKPMTDKVYTT